MATEDKNTELRILEAAKSVFVRNGFDGATMKQISDEAGINKALLHYYFRNKEKLFEAVFLDIFNKFIPGAVSILSSGKAFDEKIRLFVHSYVDMLIRNPLVPIFILREINRNPDLLIKLFSKSGINPDIFLDTIETELKKEGFADLDPRHFLINILGLCVFPIAARPLIQRLMFESDQESFDQFLEERKEEVADFVIQAISKKIEK